jgi:hypothetical protein
MAAGETPTLLRRRKECGRLDRRHSGVLARVLSGRRSRFVDTCIARAARLLGPGLSRVARSDRVVRARCRQEALCEGFLFAVA